MNKLERDAFIYAIDNYLSIDKVARLSIHTLLDHILNEIPIDMQNMIKDHTVYTAIDDVLERLKNEI
jgi:hypothetical protein